MASSEEQSKTAVDLLRQFLAINTAHPAPDYQGSTRWLEQQAENLGLQCRVEEAVQGKPTVVITRPGLQPSLPSLLLCCHTDVVPATENLWTQPAFEGTLVDGKIYGRGAQDMKSVGVQYLSALAALTETSLQRTVHLSFNPDEEIGGHDGLAVFVKTDLFKSLNVGFGMDEGLASSTEVVDLFYGERNEYWFEVHIPGAPGHGSRFVDGTAAEKARQVINKMLDYREEQRLLLVSSPHLELGDVASCNLTMLHGGTQANVVPDSIVLTFDVRLPPTTDLVEWEEMLLGWLEECGEGITVAWLQKMTDQSMTSVSEEDSWYSALSSAFKKNGLKVRPQIFSAGTDARILRELGIPTIGFSPMPETPILLHDHDEYIEEKVFLRGIQIYKDIIFNLANVL